MNPKNSWSTPKFFWVVIAGGLLAVNAPANGLPGLVRQVVELIRIPSPAPTIPGVDVEKLTPPYAALRLELAALTPLELSSLGDFYTGLSRAVAADPASDPVMPTTASLRLAHRAGLLFVWRGGLGNQPDKYPSLRVGIEGVLTDAIGEADVPLNPAIKQSAAACFSKVAALCQSATPSK